ncbi:hypothetical protein [Portibacter marinus]|uniref:hypothetical protein n=1 Tax=Portibacter marinus TaxID=2898660 RepID=UPI001F3D40D3|nr:hypothetical protein [Portibacter marinus]
MSNIEPKSIKKGKVLPISMDFKGLKREGIEHIQKLSGKIWTDYNEHDPGITILENLCFALTELGYKSNFSVPDLFFSQNGEKRAFAETFYKANEVLPAAPTTINDYRKLLIDNVKEVKNAWLVPKRQSSLGAKVIGLYEVLLLLDEEKYDRSYIINKVLNLLNKNRNLCEDFESIKILEPENISIEADISISQNSVGEAIIARIISKMLDHFAPNISLYNLEEILEKGYSYESAFNNPPIENGLVLDNELEKSSLGKVNQLFKSDLIRLISDTEGVEQVINFSIFKSGKEVKTELIQLDDYKIPNLDISKIIRSKSISLYAGEILYAPDENVIQYTLDTIRNRDTIQHKRFIDFDVEETESSRIKEEIEYYYSIQNSFPRNYGITDYGLQGKQTDMRLAQVKQLRAYLFVYEQIMANYLRQLVNVDKLLSADEDINETYFFQPLDYINGYEDILGNGEDGFEETFKEILSKYDNKYERRNRFLDHILARFGEEFLSEAYSAIHRESSSYAKIDFLKKTIDAKLKYIKNYVEIGRDKAVGFNKMEDFQSEENVSSLKKKICLLFNIKDYSYKKLSEIKSSKDLAVEETSEKPKSKTKANHFTFTSGNKNILSEILAYGVERSNYHLDNDGKNISIFFENPVSRESILIYKGKDIKQCENDLTKLIKKLTDYNSQSEGFHIIEHILLRDTDSRYCFTYLSDNNVLLRSKYQYLDPEIDQLSFVADLIQFGKVKKNYKVEKIGEKQYALNLTDDSGNIVASNDSFLLKKSADDAIPALIEEIKATPIDSPQLEFRIQYEQDLGKIKAYDDDPFSLQMSFIIPSWSGRFNSSRMKYLFENIVKINAPAHLKLNFFWLGIEDLAKFEEYYEKWLEERCKPEPTQPLLDDLSHLLLLFIKKFDSKEVNKNLEKEIASAIKALK